MKKKPSINNGELFRTKMEAAIFVIETGSTKRVPIHSVLLKVPGDDFVQPQTGFVFIKVIFEGSVGIINRSCLKRVYKNKNRNSVS